MKDGGPDMTETTIPTSAEGEIWTRDQGLMSPLLYH